MVDKAKQAEARLMTHAEVFPRSARHVGNPVSAEELAKACAEAQDFMNERIKVRRRNQEITRNSGWPFVTNGLDHGGAFGGRISEPLK